MDSVLNAVAFLVGVGALVFPWVVAFSPATSRFSAVESSRGLIAIATFLVMILSSCGVSHLARDIDPDYCEKDQGYFPSEYDVDRCIR